MILLDTNVISEPLRSRPDPVVVEWLDAQAPETLHLSTVSLAEVRFGIARLPDGRRRTLLHDRFEQEVVPLFAGRMPAFDDAASVAYASLRAQVQRQGLAVSPFDALIAAIAQSQGLGVATRDTSPFLAVGLDVINPFADRS